jgi:hypothetical protein
MQQGFFPFFVSSDCAQHIDLDHGAQSPRNSAGWELASGQPAGKNPMRLVARPDRNPSYGASIPAGLSRATSQRKIVNP